MKILQVVLFSPTVKILIWSNRVKISPAFLLEDDSYLMLLFLSYFSYIGHIIAITLIDFIENDSLNYRQMKVDQNHHLFGNVGNIE